MERRKEARIRTDKPVELTVLGNCQSSSPAQAVEFSGNGLQLVTPMSIAVGAAVKVEGDDWMMLAEVCYCRAEGIHFAVGLRIDQALQGLEELSKLNEHLLQAERDAASRRERKEILR